MGKSIASTTVHAAVWVGATVGLGGMVVLAGYAWHIPRLVQITPGRDISITATTGVCLILAGAALVALAQGSRRGQQWATTLGMAVLALSSLALAENLLDVNLGVDWGRFRPWLVEPALRPGRMSPNGALGFMLFGLAVLLLPQVQTRRGARQMRWLTGGMVAVAASGIADYLIHSEALYTFHGLAPMAPYTAAAQLTMALGLWLGWRGKSWNRPRAATHTPRIMGASVVAVIVAVLIAAVANLAVLWHLRNDDAMVNLSLRRDERVAQISELIQAARLRGRQYAYQQALHWPILPPGAAPLALPPAVGFAGATLYNGGGQPVASFGLLAGDAGLSIAVAPGTWLLWSGGYVLRQRLPARLGSRTLGAIAAEQRLPMLAGIASSGWGNTGEIGMCGHLYSGSTLIGCFPRRLRNFPFTIHEDYFGQERPSTRALAGKTGVMESVDYRRQRVLSAYAPVDGLNLGLSVEMDTNEIYRTIRRQVELMVPLLLVLILGALEVLRWQIRPLVTELEQSRNRALESETRFRAAAESSQDAFFIFECEREPVHGSIRDFRVVYVNQPGESLAACPPQLGAPRHLSDCPRLAAHEHLQRALRQVVATRLPVNEELALAHGRGLPQWLHHQAVPLGDGVAVTLRDISERKWEQERLISLAETDSLTGLANRGAFRKRLQHAMEASRRLRQQSLLALLYLDIDYFKEINDSLGHVQGDRLLQIFATRLRACVRSLDTVARLGGDEFTVLLENLDGTADAERVVAAIYAAMRQPMPLEGEAPVVTASIGVAFYRGEPITPDELLRHADTALYQAKRSGRNVFRVFAA